MAEEILAQERNRGFGDVELASGRALERFSRAGHDGAQNLVDKALRALEDGDREPALRYLRTGARLPFDDREQAHPLAWICHMELFNLVSDMVEGFDQGDFRWLDAAIEVLDGAEEGARTELRAVLATIDRDYQLSRRESKAVQVAIAPVAEHPALPDQQLDEATLVDHALQVLEACHAYASAVQRSTG